MRVSFFHDGSRLSDADFSNDSKVIEISKYLEEKYMLSRYLYVLRWGSKYLNPSRTLESYNVGDQIIIWIEPAWYTKIGLWLGEWLN